MFGIHDLALFVVSGLLLNITPGPDNLLIIGRSTSQGARAGLLAALGIACGCFVHVFAAAFGLSAILATSAAAFTVVKLAGAAYLIYIGVGMLLTKIRGAATQSSAPVVKALSPWRIFAQGFLTNVLNPKVALFFLAFVPQFIVPDAPDKALAFLFLGTLFNVNALIWTCLLALSAAALSRRFKASGVLSAWFNRAVGGLFVGLGLKLALSEQH
ncbi:MAG: LysE family translocator [Rudaea sp.]|uniref:LysE family translocator n=1 Tax=unclassified Rudaea TaxID=2627037 RepID=UPI0010F610F6|nr:MULTISPECIES: LysE family translocator [unclassified Rudaea]MBN8884233.1 LysE family translocator [Rudaea sp.]MBR0347960.1 LysE family translocator [Rudaea sp.]